MNCMELNVFVIGVNVGEIDVCFVGGVFFGLDGD